MNFRILPVRVDGNRNIGYGHFYRTLSLASMLSSEFRIIFFCRDTDAELISKINEMGFHYIGIGSEISVADEAGFILRSAPDVQRLIIIDGYRFTDEYQLTLRKAGFKILNVADEESSVLYTDVIISQCLPQNVKTEAKIYSGFNYALLRKTFYEESRKERIITKADTAFIIFGSALIKGLASSVLKAFTGKAGIKEIHIVRPFHRIYMEEIEPFTLSKSYRICLYSDVSATEMADLMRISDFAFAPSSVSSLEACTVGIGLFSGYTAVNQICTFENHRSLGTVFPLGDLHKMDSRMISSVLDSDNFTSMIRGQVVNQKKAIQNYPGSFVKIVNQALF